MERISVLGAGSWGTALALVLAENGHDCALWTHRCEQAKEINRLHRNESYLPGIQLPESLRATADLQEAVRRADLLVFAVPTSAMREVASKAGALLEKPTLLVHVSKGVEPDTLKRMSEILEEEIPAPLRSAIVVLSGPSHAEEVVLHHPTTVAAASLNKKAAERVQDAFMNQYFRVYTNDDVIGVEIGAALKNVIALAAGITDGIGYGDNAKAALITRGLSEISRLGAEIGAQPLTFAGLAGMGDLIVTCTSVHSRNWRAGHMLGKGMALDAVLADMGMVVEGVRTAKAAHQLAEKYGVAMPIAEALYDVLRGELTPQEAAERLMMRGKKEEREPGA